MSEEEILEIIRTRLTIEVKTISAYTGGNPLYEDHHYIQLKLGGELISETSI